MVMVNRKDLEKAWHSKVMRDMIESLIERFTVIGEKVLDPFCGTGAVPMIADRMQRKGYCCDISKKYLEIARKNGVNRIHRCNAADLHQYPDRSIDLIITSPPTIEYGEKYDKGEPDIRPLIESFIKEARRILRKDRVVIFGVKEDAEKYKELCRKHGLKLTFVALEMNEKYIGGR